MSYPKASFLGLGTQKAGTSWIHACLYEHPEVYLPPDKEIHYFSRRFDKGEKWYGKKFLKKREDQIAGELSPTYLPSLDAPERIQQYNSDIKLIICVRHPVDRAFSAFKYAQQMREVSHTMTFEEAIRNDPAYVDYGMYGKHIERYGRYFCQDQIKIVLFDDLIYDAKAFMKEIYKFLGIDSSFESQFLNRKVNVSKGTPKSKQFHKFTQHTSDILHAIGMGHIAWKLRRTKMAEAIISMNTKKFDSNKKIHSDTMKMLMGIFVKDIELLSTLTKTDYTQKWLNR